MKKWIGLPLLVLLASFVGYFLLFRKSIPVDTSFTLPINKAAVTRGIIESRTKEYWPVQNKKDAWVTDSSFVLNGFTYILSTKQFSSVDINIAKGNELLCKTTLLFIDSTVNFVKVQWIGSITASSNPFTQWQHSKDAEQVRKDMGSLCIALQTFYSKTENIYGIEIKRERVIDSTLIMNYDIVHGYPSIEKIYSLIDELKNYVVLQKATVTDYPMLNVFNLHDDVFQVKVALPVDKKLPPKGRMEYKWMLGGGYILASDVVGGDSAVDSAFRKIEMFAKDFRHLPPAISFYSLITDRQQQKDTSQWKTRIYYPIME